MEPFPVLKVGSEIQCLHCRRWHPVSLGHTEGTPYTLAMLYFVCRGGRYYAGQSERVSRHPTRSYNHADPSSASTDHATNPNHRTRG